MRYEILQNGTAVNTIIASPEFMAENFAAGTYRAAEVQAADAKEPRRITVGAFYDRFGAAKWGILADASPLVQAVIKDSAVRSYIDLDNPELPAGLAILQSAGHTIDVDGIVKATVLPNERP